VSQQVRGTDNVGLGKATGSQSHAEGTGTASAAQAHAEGVNTTASGAQSHAEGTTTAASGSGAHAEGGFTVASGNYSHAEGSWAKAFRYGQHAKASGQVNVAGDVQYSNYSQFATTTDATATVLTSGGGAVDSGGGAATSVLTIPVSVAMYYRIELIARRTDVAGECAAWTITGAFSRDATGAPRDVGSPTTVTWADAAASAWTAAVSIANPSGSIYYLALTATGEAAKTIRWCATVHTTEAS
jgi:hypothetical protein